MNPFRALGLVVLVAVLPVCLAQVPAPKIEEALKQWKTMRVTFSVEQGDCSPLWRYFLLQRMNKDQVVLSTGEGSSGLAVACSVITDEAAQKLIAQTLAFYGKAQNEVSERERVSALPADQRDAYYRKEMFGIDAAAIRVDVLNDRGQQETFTNDFADGGPSMGAFRDFVTSTGVAQ